jgi:membrane protease YdiL (CAAX protease family)
MAGMAGLRAALQANAFTEAAAQGRGRCWRYALCYAAIAAAYIFVASMLFAVATLVGQDELRTAQEDFLYPLEAFLGGHLLADFVFAMGSIILLLAATLPAATAIHQRGWMTLFTGRARFDWRGFGLSLGVALVLFGLWLAAMLVLFPDAVRLHADWRGWLRFLPWVLALVPLQTLAEEVFFRGYVLQTVCAATANVWLRLAIPSAVFFAPHLWNAEVAVGGLWAMADYALISLYMTLLAIRGNGLETAWGMHLALNWFLSLVLVISPGTLATPAPFTLAGEHFALAFAATAVAIPLHYMAVFRRR